MLFSKPAADGSRDRWVATIALWSIGAAALGLSLVTLRAGAQAPADGLLEATSIEREPTDTRDLPQSTDDPTAAAATRMREGTQLKDRLGRFRQNGESLTFIDDDGRELGGLPNLNLERIIRMLKAVEEPDSVHWSVSGSVTEFGWRNYLLISRAVYKAATLPPPPDAVQ
jgi:hypothetical protein